MEKYQVPSCSLAGRQGRREPAGLGRARNLDLLPPPQTPTGLLVTAPGEVADGQVPPRASVCLQQVGDLQR